MFVKSDKWFVQGSFYFALQYFCEGHFFPFYTYIFLGFLIFCLFYSLFFLFPSTAQLKTQHTVYDTCNLHLKCKDSLQDNSRHSSHYSINTLNFIIKREGSRREKDFLKTVGQSGLWSPYSKLKKNCDFEITLKVSVWPAIPAIVGTWGFKVSLHRYNAEQTQCLVLCCFHFFPLFGSKQTALMCLDLQASASKTFTRTIAI